jgi:hypothetical protein
MFINSRHLCTNKLTISTTKLATKSTDTYGMNKRYIFGSICHVDANPQLVFYSTVEYRSIETFIYAYIWSMCSLYGDTET